MSTKAGVGMSYHHNPNVAGREAAEQALQKAGVSKPDSLVRAIREATAEVHPSQVVRLRAR
jgi:hypothetical protein